MAEKKARSYNDVINAKSNASSPIPVLDPFSIFLKYLNLDSYKTDTSSVQGDGGRANIKTTDIYPSDFFNVQNPQAVYLETDIKTSKNTWKSIMSGQNNFFKDLKIEDNGGAKKFTLTLFDRDFYNLEELISGTVAFSQTSYNYLDEEAAKYSREPISIKSELTKAQADEIFGKRKEILDKVFKVKKPPLIEAINTTASGKPVSVELKRFSWKAAYSKDEETSAKLGMAIISYCCKIYNNSIRSGLKDETENDETRAYFSKRELANVYNLFNDKENYKKIIDSLSVANNTSELTLEKLRDYFYNFVYYIGTSGSRNVYDVTKTVNEYKFSTNNALQKLLSEINAIANYERATLENNALQAEASNNVIQLIETKNEVQPNIRIRFGYTDQNYGGDAKTGLGTRYAENASDVGIVVVPSDTSKKQISYSRRLLNKYTMIRGPYYNFIITGVQSKISKEGLYYTLTGFSMSSLKFDKFKLVQKFAKLKGTATEVLAGLFITFNEKLKTINDTTTIKSPIQLKMDSKAYSYLVGLFGEETEIEIPLGSESCIGKSNSYKSIRSLFNDICSVFPRKEEQMSNKSIKLITQDTEGNAGEVEQTRASELYPFSYIVRDNVTTKASDGTVLDNGIEVIFYYKEPTKFKYCRVYDWGLTRNTIVKDLEINNKNEYASLASFSMYDKDNKEFTMQDFSNANIGNKLKATNYTNDFILANQVSENSGTTSRMRLKNAINESLINSLYEGSITIPGDPFYMFDDNIVPFCYPIKVNVWRPSGNQGENGRIDSQGAPALSYVSGYYVITSISHNIGLSGYTTTLGIMKYPGIDKALSSTRTT